MHTLSCSPKASSTHSRVPETDQLRQDHLESDKQLTCVAYIPATTKDASPCDKSTIRVGLSSQDTFLIFSPHQHNVASPKVSSVHCRVLQKLHRHSVAPQKVSSVHYRVPQKLHAYTLTPPKRVIDTAASQKRISCHSSLCFSTAVQDLFTENEGPERCPPTHRSRAERLKAKVEPLLT